MDPHFTEEELSDISAFQQQNGAEQEYYQKASVDQYEGMSNQEAMELSMKEAGFKVEMNGSQPDDQIDSGKRKADGEDSSPPEKKAHIEIRKLLPDLEKHWKPVEDDPADFTSWTYLLQYVDQENELLPAREAYDSFLARYPFCYGYWKKYADFEKRKESLEDCEKVFRRGLKAIPLSVDLWVHYLNHAKSTHENEEDYIRQQYENAIEICGMEFRSDKLWDHYISWEKETNNLRNVMALYDRVLASITQNFTTHFQNMKDFVDQNEPEEIVSVDEYLELKSEIANDESVAEDKDMMTLMKEAIVKRRTAIHKKTEEEMTPRWTFEEAIKRPYFHVKPLEKGQLKNWKDYLDFEIGKGDKKRIHILFERCLIACALYEEYWLKYISYLESQPTKSIDEIRSIYVRAYVHHSSKLALNLQWAGLEESQGDIARAREILEKMESVLPDSLHICYRRISLERRQGNLMRVKELFESFIKNAKSKTVSLQLTIKYARFISKLGDYSKAIKLLKESIDIDDEMRPKIIMALIDLGMQANPIDFDMISSTFDDALKSSISDEQKVSFAHRKIEFHEDFGHSIEKVNEAHSELNALAKVLREKKVQEGAPAAGAEGDVKPPTQNYNQYGQYANWNYQQPAGYGASYNQNNWSAYQGYYE